METRSCSRCEHHVESPSDLCESCDLCPACCCGTRIPATWDQLPDQSQLAVARAADETWRIERIDAPPWHALPSDEPRRWVQVAEAVDDAETSNPEPEATSCKQ